MPSRRFLRNGAPPALNPDGRKSYRFQFGGGTTVGPHIARPVGALGSFRADGVSIRLVPRPATVGLQAAVGKDREPVATPNPVRTGAQLAFATSRAGPVTVRILDIKGQAVRRLVDDGATPVGLTRALEDLGLGRTTLAIAQRRRSAHALRSEPSDPRRI